MVPSKQQLKTAILDNKESSTGYCISCVFHWYAKQKMSYHVFVYNGSEPKNVTKVFSNVDSVIDLFCSIIQSKFNCFETKYEVAFLICLCDLKHKSTSEIAVNWKKAERNLHFNGLRGKIRTSFKLF